MSFNIQNKDSGGTDVNAASWNTNQNSYSIGSVVIVSASLYHASAYFGGLVVSGGDQNWVTLPSVGYTSNLGYVGAAYCIVDRDLSGQAWSITTTNGDTYDGMSYTVTAIKPLDKERLHLRQFKSQTGENCRTNADVITPVALATLQTKNFAVCYAGALNNASAGVTFTAEAGWTKAQENAQVVGGTKNIANALFYKQDGTDTAMTITVSAASDYLYGTHLEFAYESRRPSAIMLVQN